MPSLRTEREVILGGEGRDPNPFVVCQKVPPAAVIVGNPVVVFEVLSDGTASTGLIDKNAEHRASPAIRRYVILQQTGGRWWGWKSTRSAQMKRRFRPHAIRAFGGAR